jgi:hypothetical protein
MIERKLPGLTQAPGRDGCADRAAGYAVFERERPPPRVLMALPGSRMGRRAQRHEQKGGEKPVFHHALLASPTRFHQDASAAVQIAAASAAAKVVIFMQVPPERPTRENGGQPERFPPATVACQVFGFRAPLLPCLLLGRTSS